MPSAALESAYLPETALEARRYLEDLKDAHRNLIAQMTAMEALATADEFDASLCTSGRWRLSQASLTRRLLAARICQYLLSRPEVAETAEIKRLADADQAMLRESTAHLGRWPTARLVADWQGFCLASRDIRRKTHEHIAHEQRLLYPLLEDAANRF